MAAGRGRRGGWRRPGRGRREVILLAAVGVLLTVLVVLILKVTIRPPRQSSSEAALLVVKGLLLDAGLSAGDIRPAGRGGAPSLSATVDPDFPLESFRGKVGDALRPFGWKLDPATSAPPVEGWPATLVLRGGDGASLSLVIDRRRALSPGAARHPGRPRLAIVIDDLGLRRDLAARVAAFDAPLTIAVIPSQPASREAADLAAGAGKEVLLHLPMEPLGFPEADPGPGALMTGMTPEEMGRVLTDDLASVPGAVGVNNHMGSRLTADRAAMKTLMRLLSSRSLVFLDSRTSPDSVALESARRAGIRAANRDVFLDNIDDPEYIRIQIDEAVGAATKHGSAVAIGHPRENTIATLEESLGRIRAAGVDIVPLSRLTR